MSNNKVMETNKVSQSEWEWPLEDVENVFVMEQRVRALPKDELASLLAKLLGGINTISQMNDAGFAMQRYGVVVRRSWELEYRSLTTVEQLHDRMRSSERAWKVLVGLRKERGEYVEGSLTPEEECMRAAHNVEQYAMFLRGQEIRQIIRN